MPLSLFGRSSPIWLSRLCHARPQNKRERKLSNRTFDFDKSAIFLSNIKGKNAHDYPRRIGLRESDARNDLQRGSNRGQMQKISAGKFHYEPPFTSFDHL